MTKRNAQDATVSPDDERPQESAGSRNLAEPHGHGAKSAAVRERAIVALLAESTIGAARTVAELGIHRDDAETILRKLGEILTMGDALPELLADITEAARTIGTLLESGGATVRLQGQVMS